MPDPATLSASSGLRISEDGAWRAQTGGHASSRERLSGVDQTMHFEDEARRKRGDLIGIKGAR